MEKSYTRAPEICVLARESKKVDLERLHRVTIDVIMKNKLTREIFKVMTNDPSCKARLASAGYRVSRERVRAAMRRIDPDSCTQRSVSAINRLSRQRYSVAAPLSMIHIDGKLLFDYP